jgi:hypothetical protein
LQHHVAQPAAEVEDFLLGSLQRPDVRLKRELRLKVRRTSDAVTLSWDAADISVSADSLPMAVDRFRRRIVDEFLSFKQREEVPTFFSDAMYEGRP